MNTPNTEYRVRMDAAIRKAIEERECQPILFVGSGLTRRYFGAPNWHDALRQSLSKVLDGGPEFDYYVQRYGKDAIKIGTIIATRLHEWAWGKGKSQFPESLFTGAYGADIFLKYLVANNLSGLVPEKIPPKHILKKELDGLSKIRPHAIITTNFDQMIERIFENYEPIIGDKVIRYNLNSFGEIFKIHGCVSQLESMVLTEDDFEDFGKKKKYISSKLLTYFAEHPVFIFGYSFNDPNVISLMDDIGEILANDAGVIPNVVYVIWDEKADSKSSLPEEYVLSNHYRVKAIVTNEFDWIFNSLSRDQALKSINPKLVRSLAARAYKLVRTDLPKGIVEVDYSLLEQAAEKDDMLPSLLGITLADSSNMSHPLTLTQVAKKLGYTSWQSANKLIEKVNAEKDVDLRATDNKYHCQIKSGEKSIIRKWSLLAVDLLRKVKDGENYTI